MSDYTLFYQAGFTHLRTRSTSFQVPLMELLLRLLLLTGLVSVARVRQAAVLPAVKWLRQRFMISIPRYQEVLIWGEK